MGGPVLSAGWREGMSVTQPGPYGRSSGDAGPVRIARPTRENQGRMKKKQTCGLGLQWRRKKGKIALGQRQEAHVGERVGGERAMALGQQAE